MTVKAKTEGAAIPGLERAAAAQGRSGPRVLRVGGPYGLEGIRGCGARGGGCGPSPQGRRAKERECGCLTSPPSGREGLRARHLETDRARDGPGGPRQPPRAYLQQGAGQRRGQGGPRKPAHRQAPGPAHPSETLQGRVPGRLAGPGTGPPRTRAREDEGNQWSPGSNNRTAEPSL